MKWYKVQISYNGMASTGYIRSDFYHAFNRRYLFRKYDLQMIQHMRCSRSCHQHERQCLCEDRCEHGIFSGHDGKRDQTVNVLGQTTTNGTVWYNVTFNKNGVDYAGWICGTYLAVTGQTSADGSQGRHHNGDG